jgi:hypothetical protein
MSQGAMNLGTIRTLDNTRRQLRGVEESMPRTLLVEDEAQQGSSVIIVAGYPTALLQL